MGGKILIFAVVLRAYQSQVLSDRDRQTPLTLIIARDADTEGGAAFIAIGTLVACFGEGEVSVGLAGV